MHKILREGLDSYRPTERMYRLVRNDAEYGVIGYERTGDSWGYWGAWYFPIATLGQQEARDRATEQFEKLIIIEPEGENDNEKETV